MHSRELEKTRRAFYPKWIILRDHGHSYVTLPSSSLDRPTLTHLIITKQAWPLSPFMDEILDHMECWGREEDGKWYRKVLNWISHICAEGIRRDNLGLLYDCIALRVRDIVDRYARTTLLTRSLLQKWREHFFRMYASGLTGFAELYEDSIDFVLTGIENSFELVSETGM